MKYIPADKLLAEIERRKIILDKYKDSFETAACCKQELEWIKDLISSFQQEQLETPSGEEVMTMCNQILIDWVKEGKTPEEREQREQAHIRFFELYDEYMQEQPEVDLEKIKNLIRAALNGVTRLGSLCDDQTIEHAVDNLIDKLGLNARKEEKIWIANHL